MPKAGYTQLSYYQKLHLKEMLEKGYTKTKMAEKLHVHRSTIFNEIKRGTVDGVYDPAHSEKKRLNVPRIEPMLKKDPELAAYISELIIENHMSPEMIINRLKEENNRFKEYPSSPVTIYSAIDEGLVPGVTKEQLNSKLNMNIAKVYSDSIRFPTWLRKRLQIKDGDRYRFECRRNGDIVLKKIKDNS